MRRVLLSFCGLLLAVGMAGAQDGPKKSQTAQDERTPVVRDPDLESESVHNLKVARHYFKLKKAYRAALARCEEVIAGDPTFPQLDEVLYIAGVSSLRLSENKGKQAPNIPVEQLRTDAREYLSRVVNEFPRSEFRKRAEQELQPLGGIKPKQQQ